MSFPTALKRDRMKNVCISANVGIFIGLRLVHDKLLITIDTTFPQLCDSNFEHANGAVT